MRQIVADGCRWIERVGIVLQKCEFAGRRRHGTLTDACRQWRKKPSVNIPICDRRIEPRCNNDIFTVDKPTSSTERELPSQRTKDRERCIDRNTGWCEEPA